MNLPSLVIFDCDGVLVDSEGLSEKSLMIGLKELGVEISRLDLRRAFTGLSWPDVLKKLETNYGAQITDRWLSDLLQRDEALFRSELKPVPGIRGAIESIQALGISTCVASSGAIEKMQLTLGLTQLLPLFEGRLFSASMVERGKPYPDLFQFAAESLGYESASCLVVEDSQFGVRAGVAAGMRVLAYAGDSAADLEALCQDGGEVFYRMSDLPNLLSVQD